MVAATSGVPDGTFGREMLYTIDDQAMPSLREQAYWALLGVGCTWFLGDSTFLELPWWVDSQPEGLKVSASIVTAGSLASIPVAFSLLLRVFFPRQFSKVIVPLTIFFSLLAGTLIAAGLWKYSSAFIYVSVLLSQTVGGMITFGILPWVLENGFRSALISSLYFGGSLASLSASVLAMVQSPGDRQQFSPSVFFLGATVPILGSLAAFFQIKMHGIGKVQAVGTGETLCDPVPSSHAEAVSLGCRRGRGLCRSVAVWLPNFDQWWASALVLAFVSCFMSMNSWGILRAALPFATAHTIPAHSHCSPHCSEFCSSHGTDNCNFFSACQISHSGDACVENRGEIYLQWTTTLGQWAFSAGTAVTIVCPPTWIFCIPVLWLLPFVYVLLVALVSKDIFEFEGSGYLLVGSMLLARFCQGYFEVMQFRFIAKRYKQDSKHVTVFLGVLILVSNVLVGPITTLFVHLGIFSD